MDGQVLNPSDGARRQSDRIALPRPAVLLRLAPVLLAAAAVVVFWGGIAADALRIFFGAGLIAFLICPLAKFFERRFSRAIASTLALICFAAVILGIFALSVPPLIRQTSRLSRTIPETVQTLRGAAEAFGARIGFSLNDLNLPDMRGLTSFLQKFVDSFGEIAAKAYQFALMVILSGFLCAGRERVLLRMEWMIPLRWRRDAVRAGMAFLHEIRLYMRGQATIALSVGALSAIGLLIVGVDGAIALGLIVGIFNMIPYFGPLLGSIPAVLMALSIGWKKALFSALALFLVQQIDGLLISPRVMGSVTGFSPGTVLIALYLSSRVAGVWGMLLAIPFMMGVRTVYRVFVQRH